MSENRLLDAALYYADHFGYSVIPVKEDGSKKPYVKWERYQTEKASPETIKMWWQSFPNAAIGIVTGKISGISVIDVDLHKMSDEEVVDYQDKFTEILTPTAMSPRKGLHYYFQYCPDLPNKPNIYKHVDGRNDGNYIIAPPSIGYSWINGKKITDLQLGIIPISYTNSFYLYISNNINKGYSNNYQQLSTTVNSKIQQGIRDEELFHLANILSKGHATKEEIYKYLWLTGTYCCEPPFPEDEIIAKIESAMKRQDIKTRNLAEEVREWALSTNGNFVLTDVNRELQLSTRSDYQAANMELGRLCKAGLLERVGEKRGCYRKVEAVVFEDFQNVDFTKFEIKLPFAFEKYVDIFPGDLITYAGVRNAGKTALALEIARLNMNHYPVYYFSKEMNKQSLNVRLSKADDMDIRDWKFKFSSDISSFADAIQPDAINIIDYLEVDDGEYFKMADLLKKIHAKLNGKNKSIGIVMLQKHSKKSTADGGEKTEQKPVLCFNLDKNYPHGEILTATKVKNKKDGQEDAEGWQKKFKIIKGINLVGSEGWLPEIDNKYKEFDK